MKVKVNKDACIGCGACAAVAEDVFEIGDDGFSTVVEPVKDEKKDAVKEAQGVCPTGAIEVEE